MSMSVKKVTTALNDFHICSSQGRYHPLEGEIDEDLPRARGPFVQQESLVETLEVDWDIISLESGLTDATLTPEWEAEVVQPPSVPSTAVKATHILSIPDSWARILSLVNDGYRVTSKFKDANARMINLSDGDTVQSHSVFDGSPLFNFEGKTCLRSKEPVESPWLKFSGKLYTGRDQGSGVCLNVEVEVPAIDIKEDLEYVVNYLNRQTSGVSSVGGSFIVVCELVKDTGRSRTRRRMSESERKEEEEKVMDEKESSEKFEDCHADLVRWSSTDHADLVRWNSTGAVATANTDTVLADDSADDSDVDVGQPKDTVRMYLVESEVSSFKPFVHYVYIEDGVRLASWNEGL